MLGDVRVIEGVYPVTTYSAVKRDNTDISLLEELENFNCEYMYKRMKQINQGSFRVATFNTFRMADGIDVLKNILYKYAINFIGMQEVLETSVNNEILGRDINDRFHGVASNVNYGNMIVSCFPLLNNINTILTPDAGEDRAFTKSTIYVYGKKISVYNTHIAFTTTASDRQGQLLNLKNTVASDENPYRIITGDFNIAAKSELDIFANNGFTLCNGYKNNWIDTDKIGSPGFINAIDNIIVSNNITVVSVGVLEDSELPKSDHRCLYADLVLQ